MLKSIFLWWHHITNAHCEICHDEREAAQICKSCEILKEQLERLLREKNQLLERLLKEPNVETPAQPVEITRPANIPWTVRRQMLEREDRERAKLINLAPTARVSTEDLEKELDIVAVEREKSNAS